MSRNVIVTAVVVLLIALAGGAYVFMNKPQAMPENPAQTAANPASSVQPTPAMEKASLKSFMSMAGDQKCDFTDADTNNSGTVYLNSGKMRGDFTTNTNGKASMTHMINDGKDSYIWMDDQATGFKTSVAAIENMSGQTGVKQTVDIDKQVNYKCNPWTVEASEFAIPTDRKFTDMSRMMEDVMKRVPSISPNASAVGSGNPDACSACDSLEGDAKDQCKRALKCS